MSKIKNSGGVVEQNLYLTDSQYLGLLTKVRRGLDEINKADGFDKTCTGDKDTQVNIGLCSDEWTERDNALWPDDFPRRRDMKYPERHHKCPLDWRESSLKTDGGVKNGCFHSCMYFKQGLKDIRKIKHLYDLEIEYVKKLKI